jgi:hypothetical protein
MNEKKQQRVPEIEESLGLRDPIQDLEQDLMNASNDFSAQRPANSP